MIAVRRTESAKSPVPIWCPFLRTMSACEAGAFPGGYHCGLRQGGLRAPSGEEVAWLCTGGHFRACPTYRLNRQMLRGERP